MCGKKEDNNDNALEMERRRCTRRKQVKEGE
jgi:hypothetical protein